MIIGIESAYGDKRLIGRKLSFDELASIVKTILSTVSEKEFVSLFCLKLGYRELPYSDGYASYVIDLDTHKVYEPRYTFPKELDGARVLYYTSKGAFAPVFDSGGQVAHQVYYLAICQYTNDNAYYVFHCDDSFNVVADDCMDSLEHCMNCYKVEWNK